MNKNEKGFSFVEGLLLLVIVLLVSSVGWYVYSSRNKTENILSKTELTNGVNNPIKKTPPSCGTIRPNIVNAKWNLSATDYNNLKSCFVTAYDQKKNAKIVISVNSVDTTTNNTYTTNGSSIINVNSLTGGPSVKQSTDSYKCTGLKEAQSSVSFSCDNADQPLTLYLSK